MPWILTAFGFTVVICAVSIGAYLYSKGVTSYENYQNHAMMSQLDGPVICALREDRISAGSPTTELLAISKPHTTSEWARYVVYYYEDPNAFSYFTVSAVDGRVVAAHVGSCTWHWCFFDDTPDQIADAYYGLRHLRRLEKDLEEDFPKQYDVLANGFEATLGMVAADQPIE